MPCDVHFIPIVGWRTASFSLRAPFPVTRSRSCKDCPRRPCNHSRTPRDRRSVDVLMRPKPNLPPPRWRTEAAGRTGRVAWWTPMDRRRRDMRMLRTILHCVPAWCMKARSKREENRKAKNRSHMSRRTYRTYSATLAECKPALEALVGPRDAPNR